MDEAQFGSNCRRYPLRRQASAVDSEGLGSGGVFHGNNYPVEGTTVPGKEFVSDFRRFALGFMGLSTTPDSFDQDRVGGVQNDDTVQLLGPGPDHSQPPAPVDPRPEERFAQGLEAAQCVYRPLVQNKHPLA